MSPFLGRIGVLVAFAALSGAAIAGPVGRLVPRTLPNTGAPHVAVAADTRVGTNLGDLRPGAGAGVVFVDAMKQATPWTSSAALKLDKDGNVTALAQNQRAETVIYPAEHYPAGDYTLLYDGSGSLEVEPGQVVGRTSGRIVLRIAERAGGIHLRLIATDPHDHVRNVRLILPGFEATYLRQPFHPLFLRTVAPFHVLRFVHWMHADSLTGSIAAPSITSMNESQAAPPGVAPEYMIALANATGADPWFTFPMGVTNMYVAQFAARVHERLDPSLHPIFEYGQDAWRTGTATNAYATMAGRNFRLSGDPQTAALDWYSARSVQIFSLVEQTFGTDAGRVVRVLNGPVASTPVNEALDRAILSYAGAAQHADAFAVAADDNLDATPFLPPFSPVRALQNLEANVTSSGAWSAALSRTGALLHSARLPMIAYEAGVSLQVAHPGAPDPALADLFLAASRSPGMRQVNRDVLEAWHSLGGGLLLTRSLVEAPSNLNAAGLLEQLDQAPAGSYELLGVSDYMLRHPARHGVPNSAAVATALGLTTTTAQAQNLRAPVKAGLTIHSLATNNANGIDINAGSKTITGSWLADTGFNSGTPTTFYSSTIDLGAVTNPAPQAVYQSGRRATSPTLVYTIPALTPGAAYVVRLHFAENYWTAAGKRVFNVQMSGTAAVLTNYDIFKQAGAAHRAVVSEFDNVTADAAAGTITITFTTVVNAAQINGIQVYPSSGTPTPTPTPAGTPTPTPTATPLTGGADYLTYHGDNLRTGWNIGEKSLNAINVASSKFGVQQTLGVDGDVLAQPLYVAQFPVVGKGTHNLLIVATENDSVYAFDADNGTLVWQTTLGIAQISSDIGDSIIGPTYGVGGTPVIVRSSASSGSIFVIGSTEEPAGSSNFHHRIHALDIGTGADQVPALEIAATSTLSNGMQTTFVPKYEMNRPGLVWANDSVYVAFGSHGDPANASPRGWILRYQLGASGFSQIAKFVTDEDAVTDALASIWMSGSAPAVDELGNLYFVTGNGAYDANTPGGRNYGESVVKVAADLSHVVDTFAPVDWATLNTNDADFGSGGIMLLPQQPSLSAPHLAVTMGKVSKLFLLNRDKLGGEQANDAGALQTFRAPGGGVWGAPTYYDNGVGGRYVYYQTSNDVLRAFSLSSSGSPLLTQSSAGASIAGPGGSTPIVSSNVNAPGSAVVWLVRRYDHSGSLSPTYRSVFLEAYDATNVSHQLYRGSSGVWGVPTKVRHNAYVSPLVANGRVYVGATKTVTIFHLAP